MCPSVYMPTSPEEYRNPRPLAHIHLQYYAQNPKKALSYPTYSCKPKNKRKKKAKGKNKSICAEHCRWSPRYIIYTQPRTHAHPPQPGPSAPRGP